MDKRNTLDAVAAEVCEDIELSADAQLMITDGQRTGELIDVLIENKLYFDAIRVLARSLPKPDAVRWGVDCVLQQLDSEPSEEERVCLDAAQRWADMESDEERKRAAELSAQNGYGDPSAWLAAAAGWSGGSLSEEGLPSIAPADHMTAHAVASAIGVVASKDPETCERKQLQLLKMGLSVVR